jgi:hypothetical protein
VADQAELSRDALRNVATYQKAILLCILANIVVWIVAVSTQTVLPPVLQVLLLLVILAVSVTATVFVFLLATQVYSTGMGVLLGILTLFPCIGLLTLLIINSKATTVLRKHGIRVGFLGAKTSDIP